MKEERWKETKMIHHEKISLEKERLLWNKNRKIVLCNMSTLVSDSDQKTYICVDNEGTNCSTKDGCLRC